MRVAGCGFRVAGCGFRVTGCELRVAGCELRVPGSGLRVPGCGLRVAGSGLEQVAGYMLQVNFEFCSQTSSIYIIQYTIYNFQIRLCEGDQPFGATEAIC
ncbi:hypothetical protein SAMN06296241_3129 [Salinimicrobium sediminis]|uniref:Uncharacterized protein n=1 Tax=Salinimicrobium sediminis TaxID=1343891 RepID=A0A285X892_9FLAO|nr:hypothetical protein SAMN06296241_3129 [Salinimicrobium sediminis]